MSETINAISADSYHFPVVAYSPDREKAGAGQVWVQARFNKPSDASKQDLSGESRMVLVPALSWDSLQPIIDDETLQGWILTRLEGERDSMLKDMVLSGDIPSYLTAEQIGPESLLAYLEAQAGESGKLGKDKVLAWFDSTLRDSLTVMLSDAMKLDPDHARVLYQVKLRRDRWETMTGSPDMVGLEKMQKDLKFCIDPNGSLTRRLSRMIGQKIKDLQKKREEVTEPEFELPED